MSLFYKVSSDSLVQLIIVKKGISDYYDYSSYQYRFS